MSIEAPIKTISNGLVLHLDAANNKSYPGSGTTWADLSDNGNNGTTSGGPTYSSANGGSIVFDGVNDYVNIATSIAAGKSEITTCIWVYPTATNGTYHIINESINTFWQYTITTQVWYTRDTSTNISGTRNNDISTNFLALNSWNYISAVYSVSNSLKNFYVNGILRSSSTTSIDAITSDTRIPSGTGIGYAGDGLYFSGRMSGCVIYNRALSPNEILQNYNSSKSRFGL